MNYHPPLIFFVRFREEDSVAFELVEIVTPALAQEKENGKRLEKAFKAACERHPELVARFRDALIYVGYLEGHD